MKNKPLQIGITGGIGSGKSLITHIFKVLNVPVYDADSRGKWLLANNSSLIEAVKANFGPASYDDQGTLNRNYLASRVFNDSLEVEKLNALVHPKVGEDYQDWVSRQSSACYVIKEAALLFESGSYKGLDKVITVYAPAELRIARVLQRDLQRDRQQVEAIIKKQFSEEKRKRLADDVIINDESQLVVPQVLKLHEFILSEL